MDGFLLITVVASSMKKRRFFTPTHVGNLIETFFSKLARSMVRGISVDSKEELKRRIERALQELNESPIVFRWKYKLDEISVAGRLIAVLITI